MKEITYIHFSDLHIGDQLAVPLLSHVKDELLSDLSFIKKQLINLLLTAKVEEHVLHVSRYYSKGQMNKPFISRNKNILLKTLFN